MSINLWAKFRKLNKGSCSPGASDNRKPILPLCLRSEELPPRTHTEMWMERAP